MSFRKGISLVGCVLSIFTMAGLIIVFELVIGYRAVARSWPTPTPTKTPRPTLTATSTRTPVVLVMAVEAPVTSPTLPLPTASIPTPTPTPIPTPTPTSVATFIPVPAAPSPPGGNAGSTDAIAAGPASTPTATFTPSPTSTPASLPPPEETVPPISETSGWSFVGVRVYTDQYDGGLLLYGDLINDTGSSQELWYLTGTFYDAQGQIIEDEGSIYHYSPIDIIPLGGRVPFELTVEGIQSAADFDLSVEAEPSSATPRQNFEFSDLYQLGEGYGYCIGGTLRNPGNELQDYLVVVAILYDSQDRVISFGEYYMDPEYVVGDQTEEFEICVDSYDQDIARYELRAWGQ